MPIVDDQEESGWLTGSVKESLLRQASGRVLAEHRVSHVGIC
jgi:hypothetical protein